MSIIALAGLICTAICAFTAFAAWLYTHRDRAAQADSKLIAEHISVALSPLGDRLTVLEQRLGPDAKERDRLVFKGMITEALNPVISLQTSMSVKVETLWSNLATMMAQVLHQPDPARAHVDRLLEAFLNGTLTSEERLELRKYLVMIRDWEPGKESDFPIHPGEQAPAAILLLTMDDPKPVATHGGVIRK